MTGIPPERQSPEYLAKFVTDEVRWEGPIKEGGFQVDREERSWPAQRKRSVALAVDQARR